MRDKELLYRPNRLSRHKHAKCNNTTMCIVSVCNAIRLSTDIAHIRLCIDDDDDAMQFHFAYMRSAALLACPCARLSKPISIEPSSLSHYYAHCMRNANHFMCRKQNLLLANTLRTHTRQPHSLVNMRAMHNVMSLNWKSWSNCTTPRRTSSSTFSLCYMPDSTRFSV